MTALAPLSETPDCQCAFTRAIVASSAAKLAGMHQLCVLIAAATDLPRCLSASSGLLVSGSVKRIDSIGWRLVMSAAAVIRSSLCLGRTTFSTADLRLIDSPALFT